MKRFRIFAILFASLIIYGCKKNNVPDVLTSDIIDITLTTATPRAIVKDDGGSPIISRGFCWSISQNPDYNNNKTLELGDIGLYSSNVINLSANTTYFIRAYAMNADGIGYGNEIMFSTQVPDRDGNVYNTITIGDQIWLKENLRTTSFNDGSPIPVITDNIAWSGLSTPAYCYFNNDISNKSTYGALYNGFFINSYGSNDKNLCPVGWHIPSEEDWNELIEFLGGDMIAGYKMKETGTEHWTAPNSNSDNESGFTALPGGHRNDDGTFYGTGNYSYWWSSPVFDSENSPGYFLYYGIGWIYSNSFNKKSGHSIRCIK